MAFHDQTVLTALGNTIVLGVAAATLGSLCSFLMSYAQVHMEQKVLSRIASALTAVSLSVPRLAFSLGALWCVTETPWLRGSYGALWVIVVTIVIANIGIGMRALSAEMERMPRSWRDAALLSGGNHLVCMFRIVAPNILPTLVAMWRTFFILAILEIDIVLFLYQPQSVTLSVLTLFRLSEGISNTAYPLVVLQLLATAAVLLISAAAAHLLTRGRTLFTRRGFRRETAG
jgi:iron(III) transport system permease protein